MATELASWIRELGGVAQFDCLVACTPGIRSDLQTMIDDLDQAFAKVLVYEMENELPKWPQAANHTFCLVSTYIWMHLKDQYRSWYFMEADNLPLTSTWATKLATQHFNSRLPFTGKVNTTWKLNQQTKELFSDGFHLVGCAVYPSTLFGDISLVKFLKDMPDPFDLLLSGYTTSPAAGNKVNDTQLINHSWQSGNYRREQDGLIHYDCNDFSWALKNRRPGFISPEAEINHGCKDSSLYNLLRKERNPNLQDKTIKPDVEKSGVSSNGHSPSPIGPSQISPAIQSTKTVRPHKPYAKHGVWKFSKQRKKLNVVHN